MYSVEALACSIQSVNAKTAMVHFCTAEVKTLEVRDRV